MADKIWEIDSTSYIILEHFADNSEEIVLSNYGMMLWGKMTSNYNEATMGYHDNNKSNLSWGSYKTRGWNYPNLVTYMESHDEERLMYKNLRWGNLSGSYSIKDLNTALNRMKLAAAFFFTIPGPKMIWQFGELGYDYSIFYDPQTGTVPEPYGTDYAKLSPKPIRWDYFNSVRKNLYKVFTALIDLKKNYEAFRSTDFTLAVSDEAKRININHQTMNVTIIGNFNVVPISINPNFQNTGIWYDFFSGDSVNVTNTQAFIQLQPGEFHIYSTVKLPTPEPGILTDMEVIDEGKVDEYFLEQNYPNPFNPSTEIIFQVKEASNVVLKIYDILGREVKTLVDEEKNNGIYKVTWNGDNNFGEQVGSGIYFYKIQTGSYSNTKKMMLLR